MSGVAIRVTDLVKEYEVYQRPLDIALEVLTRRPRHQVFRALDRVSFEVPRGEVFGIIGANGAGKSTLLKIIAGVLDATAGQVDIAGRVTPILELGLGFNPEYSGRENIYLSSLLYGMNKAETDSKIDSIIEFSGLGEFIERPVKSYSSGMHSRLAFSIATAVDPDILIIDEALAAGDAMFVQKCLRRIRQLCSGGRTVLMVSHGTGLLAQLCRRVMWMDNGAVRIVGSAMQVVQAYDLAAHQGADTASWIETVDDDLATGQRLAPDLPGVSGSAPAAHAAVGATVPYETSPKLVVTASPAQAPESEAARACVGAEITGAALGNIFQQGAEIGRQVFRRGPVFIDHVELFDDRDQRTARLTLLKPFTLKVHYRVEGPLPKATLGIALSVNNKYDLSPVAQFFTQNIRPYETRETYDRAPDRHRAAPRGTLTLAFDYVPFRKGEYILSLGLLPNEPGIWEFYEYRHFYYPFSVDDAGMDLGAPIVLDPAVIHTGEPEKKNAPADKASGPALVGSGETTLRGEIEQICILEGGYPDKWPRHDCCPACGAGPLIDAFAKYGFRHVRCGTCNFIAVDPYPTPEIMNKLYSGAYYSRVRELFERPLLEKGGDGTPFSAPREVLESVVQRVAGNRTTGSWLDVGGGLGAFARLIQRMRPNWRVTLNELNPQSIAIARELFDFDVIDADPTELLHQGQTFDVVSSVAVLEHVPRPLEFLESYAALIKPGGWLVTIVPHFTPLNGFVSCGASPNVVPPYHVSLFNERALRSLLRRVAGLEIVALEQAGPAAFELIQHVDIGDYWDVEIPTVESPGPRSFRVRPYEPYIADALNALDEAGKKIGDYFAERDGRLFLIAYCRKPAP
ncbi:MAG: ATP-binding cassette domain-containing protein [Xanthobacteraceae bacterium]